MQENSKVPTLVATVEAGLLDLRRTVAAGGVPTSLVVSVRAAWASLVEALNLKEPANMRTCPSCARTVMCLATRCGYCWERIEPPSGGA